MEKTKILMYNIKNNVGNGQSDFISIRSNLSEPLSFLWEAFKVPKISDSDLIKYNILNYSFSLILMKNCCQNVIFVSVAFFLKCYFYHREVNQI